MLQPCDYEPCFLTVRGFKFWTWVHGWNRMKSSATQCVSFRLRWEQRKPCHFISQSHAFQLCSSKHCSVNNTTLRVFSCTFWLLRLFESPEKPLQHLLAWESNIQIASVLNLFLNFQLNFFLIFMLKVMMEVKMQQPQTENSWHYLNASLCRLHHHVSTI